MSAENIVTNGFEGFSMKKSISQWAFPTNMNLKDCFESAKNAGFEGIEVALAEEGEIALTSTRNDAKKTIKEAHSIGIELSSLATGLLWNYSLTSDDPSESKKAKDIVRKMLEVASWLGVDTILLVPGAVDVFFRPDFPIVSYDKVYERSLAALRELAPTAEKYKVSVGVENVWNKFLLSPLEMKSFVDSVGSPHVGVYFDVGNVLLFGFPEQWIRILGKRIKRVHFKDFRRSVGTAEGFVNLLYGDVNWPEVMSALREVGYDSYVTAEVFPSKYHPESLIRETSASMNRILGKN